MKTPICDFVNKYREDNKLRLHMPGHKGEAFLGLESYDITEIDGADSLYEANGIIAESEANASKLFGSKTYYSTEGSSQCIKAMVYIAMLTAKKEGKKPLILAGRNAHKAFHSAVALLDIDVEWIYPEGMENYLSCNITEGDLEKILKRNGEKPTALYITSPDYLGNIADVGALAKVCKENDVLLLVDNAHGAYLKFLNESVHPMDLGADMCCDSAHKTLPVLTGGAYLHTTEKLCENVKEAMLLFGSTSPSYLILQSLDRANAYLENYAERLNAFIPKVAGLKKALIENGYALYGSEMLKLTVQTKSYGYHGNDFAKVLNKKGIVSEFSDPDFVVLMLTPEIGEAGLEKIKSTMLSIEKKEVILEKMPSFSKNVSTLSIREAMLSPAKTVEINNSLGKVLASSSVGCPPAVPIVVSGEIIDENSITCFNYYGITKVKIIE